MPAAEHRLPRGIERYGVEPIPLELRTVTWRDLVAMITTFNLSPLQLVIGALAVNVGGLPLWWAAGALASGTLIGTVLLALIAQPGVDYGLPGQVAMRATFGHVGARFLTSPFRMVAGTYWFAAQALACSFAVQAFVVGLADRKPPLVPVALALAGVQALLAALGFDAMRFIVRVMLPLMVVFMGLMAGVQVASGDPAFGVGRVFDSPDHAFTWVAFASFVTVMWGAQLTNVTNMADLTRYSRSRLDGWLGIVIGSTIGSFVTGWIGAYAAVATGQVNPFVAVSELTGHPALLVLLLVAVCAQTTAVNVMNIYTAGLSLVNSIPRLGRFLATLALGAVATALAALPGVIEDAQTWITHLGNAGAPLAGVIVADYAVLKRTHLDVIGLFEPRGRYRYLGGLNPAALAAIAAGVAVYYAVPDGWLKAAWGVGVSMAAYILLALLQAALVPRTRAAIVPAEADVEPDEPPPPEPPPPWTPAPVPAPPAAAHAGALWALALGLLACLTFAWLRRRAV